MPSGQCPLRGPTRRPLPGQGRSSFTSSPCAATRARGHLHPGPTCLGPPPLPVTAGVRGRPRQGLSILGGLWGVGGSRAAAPVGPALHGRGSSYPRPASNRGWGPRSQAGGHLSKQKGGRGRRRLQRALSLGEAPAPRWEVRERRPLLAAAAAG